MHIICCMTCSDFRKQQRSSRIFEQINPARWTSSVTIRRIELFFLVSDSIWFHVIHVVAVSPWSFSFWYLGFKMSSAVVTGACSSRCTCPVLWRWTSSRRETSEDYCCSGRLGLSPDRGKLSCSSRANNQWSLNSLVKSYICLTSSCQGQLIRSFLQTKTEHSNSLQTNKLFLPTDVAQVLPYSTCTRLLLQLVLNWTW
jgi:hypothetical protein